MGLKCPPNISQAAMENVFSGMEDADVYINDAGVFPTTYEHHVELLCTILSKLCEHCFTINPLKCEWAIKEINWLSYWLLLVA